MKSIREALSRDNIKCLGIWFVFVAACIFFLCSTMLNLDDRSYFGMFFLNYIITILYTIVVFFTAFNRHKWRLSQSKLDYTVLMLILWFISAFALNRVMNIFDDSVLWLCILLVFSCVSLVLALLLEDLPLFLKNITGFFLGISIILFSYYAFLLVPLYVFSLPAALGLGLSLHSYVPLFLAIVTVVLAIRNYRILMISLSSGIVFSIVVIGCFNYRWSSINSEITKLANKNTLTEGKLPDWVVISQNIPAGKISERILKSDLVYKTFDSNGNWLFGDFMNRRFDEKQQHDPLIVLASFFVGKNKLNENERIKILESMYDSRHQAQERFWSGDKLETRNVVTNVRIFPECRMAYTEKTLHIMNRDNRMWNRDQEAIYTFHLPEGSVVSSLSLWISGKEEKAVLTTKSKADSAYREIVGVEQHDPSVIHWQEGNKVSVRVFPCTPSEDRKFKIGITSPLRKNGGELIYENVYFDGPPSGKATETLQISFSQSPHRLTLPKGCEEVSGGIYQVDRDYQADWKLDCAAPKLSQQTFSFNGKAYHISEAKVAESFLAPQAIYLDLNNQWTKEEFDKMWDKIKTKTVYAYNEKLIRITEDNRAVEFKQLSKNNFSLFPIYKIAEPDRALLISKGTAMSPDLSDLKGSEFADRLESYLNTSKPVALYNLGSELSPYMKTLKELRVFKYQSGSLSTLLSQLSSNRFRNYWEDSSTVVIDQAGLSIHEGLSENSGKAPDHLQRLFAYNDIMKKVAGRYFKEGFIEHDIIKEAERANIVSPVSSLIVLETRKDYERFGIEESKNSLKNASMKSSGAVPEPHEWVLLFLTGLVVMYVIYKPTLKKVVIK